MLGKFATWFIVFGLSFLVSDVFGWTEQGKAFLYIHIGVGVVVLAICVIVVICYGFVRKFATLTNTISLLWIFVTAFSIAITLLATWGATKLFDVNFYIAYQLMTFGQCLVVENNNKKKDD